MTIPHISWRITQGGGSDVAPTAGSAASPISARFGPSCTASAICRNASARTRWATLAAVGASWRPALMIDTRAKAELFDLPYASCGSRAAVRASSADRPDCPPLQTSRCAAVNRRCGPIADIFRKQEGRAGGQDTSPSRPSTKPPLYQFQPLVRPMMSPLPAFVPLYCPKVAFDHARGANTA
jgi:hypothetical protein